MLSATRRSTLGKRPRPGPVCRARWAVGGRSRRLGRPASLPRHRRPGRGRSRPPAPRHRPAERARAPSPTSSGRPPTRVATSGRPARNASWTDSGLPSHTLAHTTTSAARSRSGMSTRRPSNITGASREAMSASSSARCGPSPAMTARTAGHCLRTCVTASMKTACPFCGCSRPTLSSNGASPTPSASRTSEGNRSGSRSGAATGPGRTSRPPSARTRSSRSGETHSAMSALRAT